jgi:hypothetical protein
MTDYIKLIYPKEQFEELPTENLKYDIPDLFGEYTEYEYENNCILINGNETIIKIIDNRTFDLIFTYDVEDDEQQFDEICECIWNIFGFEIDIDGQCSDTIRVSNCDVKIKFVENEIK